MDQSDNRTNQPSNQIMVYTALFPWTFDVVLCGTNWRILVATDVITMAAKKSDAVFNFYFLPNDKNNSKKDMRFKNYMKKSII